MVMAGTSVFVRDRLGATPPCPRVGTAPDQRRWKWLERPGVTPQVGLGLLASPGRQRLRTCSRTGHGRRVDPAGPAAVLVPRFLPRGLTPWVKTEDHQIRRSDTCTIRARTSRRGVHRTDIDIEEPSWRVRVRALGAIRAPLSGVRQRTRPHRIGARSAAPQTPACCKSARRDTPRILIREPRPQGATWRNAVFSRVCL